MSQDERLMTVIQTDTKTALTDNAYFIDHPERIVHTMAKLDTDPYGKPARISRRSARICTETNFPQFSCNRFCSSSLASSSSLEMCIRDSFGADPITVFEQSEQLPIIMYSHPSFLN